MAKFIIRRQTGALPWSHRLVSQRIRLVLFALALSLNSLARAGKPFVFGASERIIFVGNDFFEHEADQCWIETALTARFPDKSLMFRNLGCSGDTVLADARSLCAGWEDFGPSDQGFNRLRDLIGRIKPTVIFVAYGMNESFGREAGLADFQAGLDRMLDMLSTEGARLVLLSPIAHQTLPPPLPDPTDHNRNLERYTNVLKMTASKRGVFFVDLFHNLPLPTSDGIHLTPDGYQQAAAAIERGLGYEPLSWNIKLSFDGHIDAAVGAILRDVSVTTDGLRFSATSATLHNAAQSLAVSGLPAGEYELKAPQGVIATASAAQWAKGVELHNTPSDGQEQKLREQIVQKNFDFFNDWRAQNDTYILGYRKHEQGRNAPEMSKFEKLAEKADELIARMRVPSPVQFELQLKK